MLILFLALACHPDPKDSSALDTDTGTIQPPDFRGIMSREDGWLRGDLHCHSDSDDDLATDLAMTEYLEDPTFLAFHPEFQENHLDFLAITNHNDTSAQYDPAFTSKRLVLLNSEELSLGAHSGIHGITESPDTDPDDDGLDLTDVEATVATVRAGGGFFSVNHPFLADIPFPWDLRDFDSLEIWNSGWGLAGPETTEKTLAGWISSYGTPGAPYQRAIQVRGQLDAGQGLAWYEALLSRGVHVALVGGSDRHAVLLPGFPITWVQADRTDIDGVFAGIQERRTFVARTPASAQILLTLDCSSGSYGLGAEIPIAPAGEEVTVTVRVGRAEGGRLQVVSGGPVASDDELAAATLGEVVYEADVTSEDQEFTFPLPAGPGVWLYPRLFEPLVQADATDDQAQRVREIATLIMETGAEDYVGLATAVSDLIDTAVLMDASNCDTDDWEAENLQCFPVDTVGFGTFFVPDLWDRALNVWVENYAITEWSMGAVGSALLFVDDQGA